MIHDQNDKCGVSYIGMDLKHHICDRESHNDELHMDHTGIQEELDYASEDVLNEEEQFAYGPEN